MIELLKLYAWVIPAGAIFAGALAYIGAHLAARDRSMQTICMSQGAVLGVLLSLGILPPEQHEDPTHHLAPFVFSVFVSASVFWVTDYGSRRKTQSKNSFFTAVFALLLAGGYFVSAFFPALESHMSQVYFGDLATLNEFDAKATAVLGLLCLAGLVGMSKPIANRSFEMAVFGESWGVGGSRGAAWAFQFFTVALVCYSVQFLGFLFTVSMLFVPTTLLSFTPAPGLRRHLVTAMLVASAATVVGFLTSLRFTRVPTVPAVVLWCAVLSVLAVLVSFGSILLFRRKSSGR